MSDTLFRAAALLVTAGLFGGMALFAGGFAAFLFRVLPVAEARVLIRQAFPPFYLFVMGTAAVAAGLAVATSTADRAAASMLAAIALTTLPARQLLMPAINDATDRGQRGRFVRLHGLSVAITLAHIAMAGVALVRLAR